MKRLFQLIAVFALPALLAACPGKNSTSDEGRATTPLTTNCLYGQTTGCYPNMYGQYPGFYPYPVPYNQYQGGYYSYYYYYYGYGYGMGGRMGFCDCGPNGYPVYNNSMGLGCVQRQVLAPIAGYMGYYSLPAANAGSWQNIPQVSNMPNSGMGACLNNVAQACFLNQPNSCGTGMVCRATSAGSGLGLCSRQ